MCYQLSKHGRNCIKSPDLGTALKTAKTGWGQGCSVELWDEEHSPESSRASQTMLVPVPWPTPPIPSYQPIKEMIPHWNFIHWNPIWKLGVFLGLHGRNVRRNLSPPTKHAHAYLPRFALTKQDKASFRRWWFQHQEKSRLQWAPKVEISLSEHQYLTAHRSKQVEGPRTNFTLQRRPVFSFWQIAFKTVIFI